MPLSSRERDRLHENLIDELNGAALYDALAAAEKDTRLSEVYRRLATVERKHAEAIFSGFFDATPDAMLLVNSEGKIVLANRQTEQLFGYAKQDLPGLPIEVLIPQYVSERQGVHQVGCPTLPKLHPLDKGLELTAIRKDRSEFPVEVSLSPLETQDGVMVVAAVRDITERKHAEAALRESEDRFRQAFDHAAIGKALDGAKLGAGNCPG